MELQDYKKYYEGCYIHNLLDDSIEFVHKIVRIIKDGHVPTLEYFSVELSSKVFLHKSVRVDGLNFYFPKAGYRNIHEVPYTLNIIRVPRREPRKGACPSSMEIYVPGYSLIQKLRSETCNTILGSDISSFYISLMQALFKPVFPTIKSAYNAIETGTNISVAVSPKQALFIAQNSPVYLYADIPVGDLVQEKDDVFKLVPYPRIRPFTPILARVLHRGVYIHE